MTAALTLAAVFGATLGAAAVLLVVVWRGPVRDNVRSWEMADEIDALHAENADLRLQLAFSDAVRADLCDQFNEADAALRRAHLEGRLDLPLGSIPAVPDSLHQIAGGGPTA